ncbi:hypothetical protein A0H81_01745 [Grifola frondosa]|uniref:Uncharacterized protein n=1 Tax=Grifola frondosa TaxID=5627 RepID=A0A1C7MM90_GRIFR|nr:hypothetical protein A0H81_01745 [Grifola frondosa]
MRRARGARLVQRPPRANNWLAGVPHPGAYTSYRAWPRFAPDVHRLDLRDDCPRVSASSDVGVPAPARTLAF